MVPPIQNPRLLLSPHFHFRFPPFPLPPPSSRHFSFSASHQTLTLDSPSPSSSILSIRHSLLSRQTSAADVTSHYLSRLRLAEPHLHSFLHVAESDALAAAEQLDRRIENGEEVGPLAGVMVGVKDNICTKDMASTGGSKILEEYRPAFDATAVRRLKEKGAIVVGKTNLDEFGMGSTTEGSGFQVSRF